MECAMIVRLADNIISPLSSFFKGNFRPVREGLSSLRRYDNHWGLPEPFVGSLFEDIALEEECTPFESLAIQSVRRAVAQSSVDLSSPRTMLILSTTKGNISLLDDCEMPHIPRERVLLGVAAQRIADVLGITTSPLVVSNACISGVCAQIAAMRLLKAHACDVAIVCGCDVQSKFIVSGFQSFKALSEEPCRPFDASRSGLNLGEAAATIVYTLTDSAQDDDWVIDCGAIRNDANHISGPSRTGEGSYRALRAVSSHIDASSLAFINVHGTATPYNDEMESIALDRALLAQVPINGLKGYYGHTMGAAGVLETIISMRAVDDGVVLPTKGYSSLGVSRNINVSSRLRTTAARSFVKLLSGFGGCNAALLMTKGGLK